MRKAVAVAVISGLCLVGCMTGCDPVPESARADTLTFSYNSSTEMVTIEGLDYEAQLFRRGLQLPNGGRMIILLTRIGDRKVRISQLLEADGVVTVILGTELPLSVSYDAGNDELVVDGGRWPAEYFRDFANQDSESAVIAVIRNGAKAKIFPLGVW